MGLKNLWAEFKAFAFKGNMIELAVAVVIGAAFSTVINSLVNDVIMPTVGYVVNTATTVADRAKNIAETTVTAAASKAGIATSQPSAAQASASQPSTENAGGTAAGATSQPIATSGPAIPPTANTAIELTPTESKIADDLKAAIAAVSAADQKAAADAKAAEDAQAAKSAPVKINLQIGPVNAGAFIGSLLNFLLVAAAVFLVIVKLLGSVMKHVGKPPGPSEPTTRECPECLSIIPIKAKRCSACTAMVPPISPTAA